MRECWNFVRERWDTAWAIYRTWVGRAALLSIVYAALALWRDEGLQNVQPPKLIADVLGWGPWWIWAIIALFVALLATFEGAYQLTGRRWLGDVLRFEAKRRPKYNETGWAGATLCLECRNQLPATDIEHCSVRCERLEGEWESSEGQGRWLKRETFNPSLLQWSTNDGDGLFMEIGPDTDRVCDLVVFEGQMSHDAVIVVGNPPQRANKENRLPFGTWRMTCRVEARGYKPCLVQLTL